MILKKWLRKSSELKLVSKNALTMYTMQNTN